MTGRTWPTVSVVMVTYGTGPIAVDTIRAADDAARRSGLEVEILVIDNEHPERGHATGDRTVVAAADRPTVRVVRAPGNLGFGGGSDVGADLARGDVIVFLNPDAFLSPEALTQLVEAAERHPDQIIAPVFASDRGGDDEFGRRIDGRGITTVVPASGELIDYASAACWAMHRSLHRRLGGFDPRYHPAYFEDVDLAFRAERAAAGTRVLADVRVVHVGGGSVDDPTDASVQGAAFRERWPHRLSR